MSDAFARNLDALRLVQPYDSAWLREADGTGEPRMPDLLDTQPAREVERWLDDALQAGIPAHIVVTGATRVDILMRLRQRAPASRILLVEPTGGAFKRLLESPQVSGLVEERRLFMAGGGAARTVQQVWHAFGSTRPAPMLVNPRLARRRPAEASAARALYARMRAGSTADPAIPKVRRSMLHNDVLLAIEQAASTVRGGILEIGAYVGGGTAAMARGLRSTGHRAPFVSIEPGGASPLHPDLPSSDIVGDLKAFLAVQGVTDRVEIAVGYSSDPEIQALVTERLGSNRIGLMVIDADGHLFRDFEAYLPLCAPEALIVVDDYRSDLAPEKAVPTRRCVDAMVDAGVARTLGVYGWGTFFGVLTRTVTAEEIADLAARQAA